MNRDVQLAIFSFAALMVSLIVAGFVLCTDHEEEADNNSAVDRQLMAAMQQAKPLGQKGSNVAFHWLMERVIEGEL